MPHRHDLSLLDLPQVETFVAVTSHGSFAKAAAVLFLTQPSVSTRIQGLERTLGQRLLERHGRGVRLTRAGGVFLPFAERLLHTVAEGRAALEATHAAEGGLLTVAAALSVSTYLLPDIIKGFRAEHPASRVSIRRPLAGRAADGPRAGRGDRPGPRPRPPGGPHRPPRPGRNRADGAPVAPVRAAARRAPVGSGPRAADPVRPGEQRLDPHHRILPPQRAPAQRGPRARRHRSREEDGGEGHRDRPP